MRLRLRRQMPRMNPSITERDVTSATRTSADFGLGPWISQAVTDAITHTRCRSRRSADRATEPTDGGVMRISLTRSAAMQARLHALVPGGAHTFAKASDQYPENMAPILVRGQGARVWDVDGNSYVEYGMGMRAVTLGHGYEPVLA